ncbi:tetratricopeptide repeat protein [Actinoplanes cyaneus]|uniref:tetratricopeptide repeat protein n=1 Tax=Actinoplanes cyaneus TaxID=52696 RepID=UPI001940E146|nr:tetratricopeptide repeat protein [Actinoplanes cyaneus]MCW2144369.1 Tetratricopeptide repeat-containing protein [Actinoplanes cyaneus]
MEELLQRATAGDRAAAELLAHMLALSGKVEKGITLLRLSVGEDDEVGLGSLAAMLAKYGRVDDAIALLQPHADEGNDYLSGQLAGLFARNYRLEELRNLADGGDPYAGELLVQALFDQGHVDELEQRADGSDFLSVKSLAVTLLMESRARQGRTKEARALMFRAGGSHDTVVRLAEVLAEQGHFDDAVELMQPRADAGDRYVLGRLAVLRSRHGQFEKAIADLRQLTDEGDPFAPVWLIELLAERGRIRELEEEVAAGTPGAAKQLALFRPRASTD